MKTRTKKVCVPKRDILKIYSHDFKAGLYTLLRLYLSPLIELERYVPISGNILDLGCGIGIFANILSLGSHERQIFGIDMMRKRIETAKIISSRQPHMRFEVRDVNSISFKGFDIITAIDLFHHMPFKHQNILLERISINLREGGLLIIKDLEKNPKWKYIFHYIQETISYKGAKLYFRSLSEMLKILNGLAFIVTTKSLASGYPHPHILYMCTRK